MFEYVQEALSALWGNRARSALSMLGIVIGVTAVVAIQIVGTGMAGAVGGVLASVNERSFFVFPAAQQRDYMRASVRLADLRKARDVVPNVVDAIPASGVTRTVTFRHRHPRLTIVAEGDARYSAAPARYGRLFTDDDIVFGRHVCIVGSDASGKLQVDGSDLGTTLRLGDRRCVLVGILDSPVKGIVPDLFKGDVYLPYSTYEGEYDHDRSIVGVRFLIDDVARIAETERDALRWIHELKGAAATYQTFDRKSLAARIDGIFNGIALVVALISAVSLLVAGVGIMNVMLVAVSERIGEIGVRKAVGARRRQIAAHFLVEACILTAAGAVTGLLIGVTVGWLFNDLVLVRLSGVVAPIPWMRTVATTTLVASAITVLFGTYPAWRASALDPVEAINAGR